MKPGSIVIIPVPQVAGRSRKLRPALVIANLPGPLHDILACGVSSNVDAMVHGWDELVAADASDFAGSGLHQTSIVRLSYINALASEDARGVIGRISFERLNAIRERVRQALTAEEDE